MPLIKNINFKKTLALLTGDEVEHKVPFDGSIIEVIMHFPSGCEALVDSRLVYIAPGGITHYVVPSIEDWIALDDVTQSFPIHLPVEKGGTLKAEWENHDGGYDHTLTTLCTLKEERVIERVQEIREVRVPVKPREAERILPLPGRFL